MRIFKKKYIIFVLIVTMLFGTGGTMYNVFIKNRQKSMLIEFNYPGSENGLNPDGSVFEISELKSTEVIERAKKNLNNHTFQFIGLALCSTQDISVIFSFVYACLVMSDSLGPLLDCRLPGSSVHGIFQARILEWVFISSSRGSSQPRDQTLVSCIASRFFTV